MALLEQGQGSVTAVDGQLWGDHDLSVRAKQYRLFVEEKIAGKQELFSLAGEVPKLGEVASLNNNFHGLGLRSVGNEDGSIFFGSLELVFNPESNVVPLAYLAIIIKDEAEMACLSHSVDQTQRTFLDNGPSTAAISDKVNNKQALTSLKFWEGELFFAFAVVWFVELKLTSDCAFKPIEVDA